MMPKTDLKDCTIEVSTTPARLKQVTKKALDVIQAIAMVLALFTSVTFI